MNIWDSSEKKCKWKWEYEKGENEPSKSKAEKNPLSDMVQKTKEYNSEIMEASRNLGE